MPTGRGTTGGAGVTGMLPWAGLAGGTALAVTGARWPAGLAVAVISLGALAARAWDSLRARRRMAPPGPRAVAPGSWESARQAAQPSPPSLADRVTRCERELARMRREKAAEQCEQEIAWQAQEAVRRGLIASLGTIKVPVARELRSEDEMVTEPGLRCLPGGRNASLRGRAA